MKCYIEINVGDLHKSERCLLLVDRVFVYFSFPFQIGDCFATVICMINAVESLRLSQIFKHSTFIRNKLCNVHICESVRLLVHHWCTTSVDQSHIDGERKHARSQIKLATEKFWLGQMCQNMSKDLNYASKWFSSDFVFPHHTKFVSATEKHSSRIRLVISNVIIKIS